MWCCGCMLASGWLPVTLRFGNGLNSIIGWNGHVEELELSDTYKVLLYCDCDLMDGTQAWRINIESCIRYQCGVWSIKHTKLYAKISYTLSLLQILHLLIPSNTWYHRWSNTTYHLSWKTCHIGSPSQRTIARTSCVLQRA